MEWKSLLSAQQISYTLRTSAGYAWQTARDYPSYYSPGPYTFKYVKWGQLHVRSTDQMLDNKLYGMIPGYHQEMKAKFMNNCDN